MRPSVIRIIVFAVVLLSANCHGSNVKKNMGEVPQSPKIQIPGVNTYGFRSALQSRRPNIVALDPKKLDNPLKLENYTTAMSGDMIWTKSLSTGNLIGVKGDGTVFVLSKKVIDRIRDVDEMCTDLLAVARIIKGLGVATKQPIEEIWKISTVYNDTSIIYLRTYWEGHKFNQKYIGDLTVPAGLEIQEANFAINTWQPRTPLLSLNINAKGPWDKHPWSNGLERISITNIVLPGDNTILVEPHGSYYNTNESYLAWIEVLGAVKGATLETTLTLSSNQQPEPLPIMTKPIKDLALSIPDTFVKGE
jgi:hypothetical protein